MCHPAEGDDVADLHLRRLDQHAIDEQLHQFPAAREGGVVEALGDRGAEGVELGRHGCDLRGVVDTGDELLLLVREIGKARLQRLHAGPQLLQGDRFRGVGVDEPLALPLEGPDAGPEVVLARRSGALVEPAVPRALHGLGQDRRIGQHLPDVGPDRRVEVGRRDGVGLAARGSVGCQLVLQL